MTTLIALLALTALVYMVFRHENKPQVQPIRIRHDEHTPRSRTRRR